MGRDAAIAFQLKRRSNGFSAAPGSNRRGSTGLAAYGAGSGTPAKKSSGSAAAASNWLSAGRPNTMKMSFMIDPKLASVRET